MWFKQKLPVLQDSWNKILYYRIEKRVEERKRKWEEDVENELKQQREATRFKARPATVLEEEFFVSFICNVVTRFSHLQRSLLIR